MKIALEDIGAQQIHDGMVKVLILMLFFGGVAAKGTTDRVWYIEMLSGLMKMQVLTKWTEVKQLLWSFVWAHILNEEAMELWDDNRCVSCCQNNAFLSVEAYR